MEDKKVTSVDEEVRVKVGSGSVCFESFVANPSGVSYVRFLDSDGEETDYWHFDEWQDSPQKVMGAIMATLLQAAEKGGEDK